MDMNQEKNQKNRSPHHDGGGLLAQVQASVEILSPVPVGGKCREKDYERSKGTRGEDGIRAPGVSRPHHAHNPCNRA